MIWHAAWHTRLLHHAEGSLALMCKQALAVLLNRMTGARQCLKQTSAWLGPA